MAPLALEEAPDVMQGSADIPAPFERANGLLRGGDGLLALARREQQLRPKDHGLLHAGVQLQGLPEHPSCLPVSAHLAGGLLEFEHQARLGGPHLPVEGDCLADGAVAPSEPLL